jgi:5-methylthioadenosine/S-adenosylhomocysteine deaminase
MATKTWIKGADWIIAWDAAADRHAYLKGGDLVMSGNVIEFVGKHYGGTADTIVDGSGLMLMPGLVDIHAHPSTEPFFRGIREEHGVAQMYMSGLFERSVAYAPDLNARKSAGEVAYCEMLLSGITTVADLSAPYPGWLDLAGPQRPPRLPRPQLRLGALAARGRVAACLQVGRGRG